MYRIDQSPGRTSHGSVAEGRGLAYSTQEQGRDLRLDLFRGLSLLCIFIDHIPNNILSHLTVHSIAFSDAAEIFVFISGYTAAVVYGNALRRQGPLAAMAQIHRRVWQLYVAHVFIFVIFAAAVSYATLNVQGQTFSADLRIDAFLAEPHIAIVKILLLQYQPSLLDILPLYVVLLGAFPLVLLLLQRNLLAPVVVSGAIYVLTLRLGWQTNGYPDGQSWYFNPLAWQFLFVIGATAGYSAHSRQSLLRRASWLPTLAVAIAALITIVNVSWSIHAAYSAFPGLLLNELSPLVADKGNLAPLRLLSFFALAVTATHFLPRGSSLLRWRTARLIILCGQHSLQVFCLGILLSLLGHILLSSITNNILLQLAIDLCGIALMIAIAGLLAWCNAHKPTRQDRAMTGHTNSPVRRKIATGSPSSDYKLAVVPEEHHAAA
jgi:hypothetical protein